VSAPGLDLGRWLVDFLNAVNRQTFGATDKPEPKAEADKVTITRTEHREMIDRIVTSFNRDAQAWIAERHAAEAKLARIRALCEQTPELTLSRRVLQVINTGPAAARRTDGEDMRPADWDF
jgi:hypothetical protein